VRAPLVEAKQDGSVRIQDLTKVVVARRCLRLAEERLVPFETGGNITYADDRPCAFHRVSAVDLRLNGQKAALFVGDLTAIRCSVERNQALAPMTRRGVTDLPSLNVDHGSIPSDRRMFRRNG
jgi:hypothetical protein